VLQSVEFDTCRLTGVNFGAVRRLPIVPEAKLTDCDLSFTRFRELDLTAWSFEGCRVNEAEFVRCDLKGVSFASAELTRCPFQRNDLAVADLRGARGYASPPLDNTLRGTRGALPAALGLLAAVGVELEQPAPDLRAAWPLTHRQHPPLARGHRNVHGNRVC